MHEHPTQALLDLRTILAHLRPGLTTVHCGYPGGVTVTIVGDILHSRVARSNMLLLPRLGRVSCFAAPGNCLRSWPAQAGPGITIERDFEAAIAPSQVIMMLRIQAERLAGLQLDLDEYKANYQLTGRGWPRMRRQRWCCTPALSSAAWRSQPEWRWAAVGDSRTGAQRSSHPHGGGGAGSAGRAGEGRPRMTALVIRGGHLIDPAAGWMDLRTFCSRTAGWLRLPGRAS